MILENETAAEDAANEASGDARSPDGTETPIAQPGGAPDGDRATGESLVAESIAVISGARESAAAGEQPAPEPAVSAEELLPFEPSQPSADEDARLRAVIEAIIYVTDEPLTPEQISAALEQPRERVLRLLEQLSAEYERPDRGLAIREIAGGYKLSTKPEHHDAVRRFVRNLKPPLKLSLPALETLAVIAYKQPITAPEIMEIRGVQGAGVLKTLIDRKLIATAGRKNVVGKPILYKTTREFLVQFGLKDLSELPTLKEFQEIGRLDMETPAGAESRNADAAEEPTAGQNPPREEPPDSEPPARDPEPGEPPVGDPPAIPDGPPSEPVD